MLETHLQRRKEGRARKFLNGKHMQNAELTGWSKPAGLQIQIIFNLGTF